jgi:ABC-type phosphate transport system auxiliary subunit
MENKEIIENQQKIIKKLEIELQKKIMTIDYLTDQLIKTQPQQNSVDLLDIN